MTDQILDLSIATLMKACKGNVKALPSFVVHDNAAWPATARVQLDNLNRIHMRRATFLSCVAGELPVKPGLWIRPDAQQFFLDLQPHHLQGSEDAPEVKGHKHSRAITLVDQYGRHPGDEGYADDAIPNDQRAADARRDAEQLARTGEARGVRSAALDADSSE